MSYAALKNKKQPKNTAHMTSSQENPDALPDAAGLKKLPKSPKRWQTLPVADMLQTLAETYPDHPMDDATGGDPFKVLIGCIISLRNKDDVTIPACGRLFALADTPETLKDVPLAAIEKAIYPSGFYKTKAQTIVTICHDLIAHFDSQVPSTIAELLTLKGVGRKTANLVLGLGFGLPSICVDTHVHRISNRWGYVNTKDPDTTEFVLRQQLSQDLWPIINWVMVRHGQETCKGIGARCDVCVIESHCAKIDVKARKPVAEIPEAFKPTSAKIAQARMSPTPAPAAPTSKQRRTAR